MSTQKQYVLVTVEEPKAETRTAFVRVEEPKVEPRAVAVTLLKPPEAENHSLNIAVHQLQKSFIHDSGAGAPPEKDIPCPRVPICKHGHAPGYLREALLEALDWNSDPWYERLKNEPNVLDCHSAEQQNMWDRMTAEERADWLCASYGTAAISCQVWSLMSSSCSATPMLHSCDIYAR